MQHVVTVPSFQLFDRGVNFSLHNVRLVVAIIRVLAEVFVEEVVVGSDYFQGLVLLGSVDYDAFVDLTHVLSQQETVFAFELKGAGL